jgi:hypothetical protein
MEENKNRNPVATVLGSQRGRWGGKALLQVFKVKIHLTLHPVCLLHFGNKSRTQDSPKGGRWLMSKQGLRPGLLPPSPVPLRRGAGSPCCAIRGMMVTSLVFRGTCWFPSGYFLHTHTRGFSTNKAFPQTRIHGDIYGFIYQCPSGKVGRENAQRVMIRHHLGNSTQAHVYVKFPEKQWEWFQNKFTASRVIPWVGNSDRHPCPALFSQSLLFSYV